MGTSMTSMEAVAIMQKMHDRIIRERNFWKRDIRDALRMVDNPSRSTLSQIAAATRKVNKLNRELKALSIGIQNTADYGYIKLDKKTD